ncbi:DUF4865 family protein [Streptomyces sp. S6]|nr:DUF4865 family protein [Streptomyces sp. S6]
MHAMQYEITLPADYDMDIIRTRVATKGHLLDAFPGLGLKAYLIRERAGGSPVNQYAPFYLWRAPEGMNAFLWGAGFQGLVDDFGRPEVQHWTGLSYEEGPAAGALPGRPSGCGGPSPVRDAACTATAAASGSGRTAAGPGWSPPRWRWTRAAGSWCASRCTRGAPPGAEGEAYEVLHLSAPEAGRLGRGRQW